MTLEGMEWDNELSLKLINEYRNNEILWNPKNSAYYNKIKKEDAWIKLSEKMGRTSEELKKKIDSLKGSYRREKARIKKSMGKGRNNIYTSKWFAFSELQFLNGRDKPRNTSSDVRNKFDDESAETEDGSLNEEELDSSQVDEESVTFQPSSTGQLRNESPNIPKKFRSLRKHSMKRKKTEDPRITKAFEYLRAATETSKKHKDQCALFADYIADKLRTFENQQRAIAQHRISTILFEIEMNKYEQNEHFISVKDTVI